MLKIIIKLSVERIENRCAWNTYRFRKARWPWRRLRLLTMLSRAARRRRFLSLAIWENKLGNPDAIYISIFSPPLSPPSQGSDANATAVSPILPTLSGFYCLQFLAAFTSAHFFVDFLCCDGLGTLEEVFLGKRHGQEIYRRRGKFVDHAA